MNEKLICGDPALSTLDEELNTLYTDARKVVFDKRTLGMQHANEWKWREKNCDDRSCLTQWYGRRKAQLQQLIAVEQQVAQESSENKVATQTSPERPYLLYLVGGIALLASMFLFLIFRRRCPLRRTGKKEEERGLPK